MAPYQRLIERAAQEHHLRGRFSRQGAAIKVIPRELSTATQLMNSYQIPRMAKANRLVDLCRVARPLDA